MPYVRRTEKPLRLTASERMVLRFQTTELAERPRCRGDCEDGPRPCPWVGCRYNLFLDVTVWGTIKYSVPGREPQDVPPDESCVLDVASHGAQTLEDIGRMLGGLSRERIRQIERDCLEVLGGLLDDWR